MLPSLAGNYHELEQVSSLPTYLEFLQSFLDAPETSI
jgi:hypothetical protein